MKLELITKVVILIMAIRAVFPIAIPAGYGAVFIALVVFSIFHQDTQTTKINYPKEELEELKNKVSKLALAVGLRKID